MSTSTTSSPPNSLDNEGFAKLWKSLYDSAVALLAKEGGDEHHRQEITIILQAMSQVIFGVDEGKKAIAICYKQGCLQLCMKLVESAHVVYPLNTRTRKIDTDSVAESPKLTNEQDAVWRGALKLIKCSVIRCNVGRTKCRTAGVFDFFQALLVTFLPAPTTDRNVALLMEECMTTLAAVCLGNDLNALQASVQLQPYVTQAATRYPQEDFGSMHQKIHYLLTLFNIIKKDEAALLACIDIDTFFSEIAQAEQLLWEGETSLLGRQYEKALEQYTTALETITAALNGNTTTKLLNDIIRSLYEKRATVNLELNRYDEALADANALLELKPETSSIARAHSLRAKIFQEMGQVEQAQEALAAAILASPQDESLQAQLKRLSVKEKD
jgi:tetratricopeptide (TPR) repeat protein